MTIKPVNFCSVIITLITKISYFGIKLVFLHEFINYKNVINIDYNILNFIQVFTIIFIIKEALNILTKIYKSITFYNKEFIDKIDYENTVNENVKNHTPIRIIFLLHNIFSGTTGAPIKLSGL